MSDQQFIETETVFHTPSGDLVMPGESIPIPDDMMVSRDSNLAPLWLVFPKHIFNTHQINYIERDDINGYVRIRTTAGSETRIKVSNLDETWEALQKVFAYGLKE